MEIDKNKLIHNLQSTFGQNNVENESCVRLWVSSTCRIYLKFYRLLFKIKI